MTPVGGDRENGLFAAVVSVAAGLELGATLRRIVKAAVDLVDAEYGALGVLGAQAQPACGALRRGQQLSVKSEVKRVERMRYFEASEK